MDKGLTDAFPISLRKLAAENAAPSLADAATALRGALAAKDLLPLLSLMDLTGDPGAANRGCARAAQAWWLLHNPEAPRHAVPLGFHESGNVGIASFQFFSPREPDRLDVRSFYFEKPKAGWLLMSGFKPTNSPTEAQTAVKTWEDDLMKTWRLNWQATLLSKSQRLDAIPAGNAPQAEDARKLVESWLAATRDGDLEAALRLTVWMSRPGGAARILQNLGHELAASAKDNRKASIASVERGETFTTVGVKSQSGNAVAFPLYLVIATSAGPRLLIETDLFANASSGRELLNNAALRRVTDFSDPESSAELVRMFEKFKLSAKN